MFILIIYQEVFLVYDFGLIQGDLPHIIILPFKLELLTISKPDSMTLGEAILIK